MAIPPLDPQCHCDLISQSAYGPVGDHEPLVRVLTSNHYNGAKVKTSAFRVSDIISEGISLVRLHMVDVNEFIAVAEEVRRAANDDEVRGALTVEARTVRTLLDTNGERQLCVFDDPIISQPGERDNAAHCMAVSPLKIDRVDALEIRARLLDLFVEARYLSELWVQSPHMN